jgi:hypothetical protein
MPIAALGVCLIAGCGVFHPPSHVDQHWGEAVQLDMAAMVANPEAGSSEPVEGLDPETGQRVADRYYKGQEQQSAREVRTFLVGED